MHECHIRKSAHEPTNGVTIHNNVPLTSSRERTGMARRLPCYITLQVCVAGELLPKEAQFEYGPGLLEGPTEEIQRRKR